MISYRQADLLDSISQDPLGKIFRYVPDDTLRYDPILSLTHNYHNGTPGIETQYLAAAVGEFLGCRDGYAFYKRRDLNSNVVGKTLIVRYGEGNDAVSEPYGKIISLEDGYYHLSDGTKLKSEQYNQVGKNDVCLIVKAI